MSFPAAFNPEGFHGPATPRSVPPKKMTSLTWDGALPGPRTGFDWSARQRRAALGCMERGAGRNVSDRRSRPHGTQAGRNPGAGED